MRSVVASPFPVLSCCRAGAGSRSVFTWLVAMTLSCLVPGLALAQAGQKPLSVTGYITTDYVAGMVLSPARLLESRYVSMWAEAAGEKDLLDQPLRELQNGTGIDLREVEQLAILLDRKTLFSMARIPDSEDVSVVDERQLKNNLKLIALAMHNFHDAYRAFPDHDGGDNDNKGNLSWRVHLLPFLGQPQLYDRFHLDEPWDSEHNKSLISEMPDEFKTPGVDEPGRTSLHGIEGENTLMSGKRAVAIHNIIDGTSNTIMFAVAAVEKSDVWTKPGALSYKAGPPTATLGDVGDRFLMARCDGSVDALPADLNEETFRRLVTYNDSMPVQDLTSSPSAPERLPTWIVRSRAKIDQNAVLAALRPMGEPVKGNIGTAISYTLGQYILAFPDERTLLAAPTDLLPDLLKNESAAGTVGTQLAQTAGDSDLAAAVDLQTLQPFKDRLAGNLPMAGVLQAVRTLQLTVNMAGPGDHLHRIVAEMENEAAAAQLNALMLGLVQIQKAQLLNLVNSPENPIPADVMSGVVSWFDHVQVRAEGRQVVYQLPRPDDFDDVFRRVLPAVTKAAMQARTRAARMRRMNNLKMIGLAFHNYHDVYKAFPRYNGDGRRDADEARRGLSWRVHLLPFLEHTALYEKFNLEEAWDSETNKALIDQMPDVFRTPGVEQPGHTSLHVFIGDKTPFDDGREAIRIRDILDGLSNTLLVVEAGPDTADIWTRPGGLKFTGEDTFSLLGDIGETFLVLMADGAVRNVSRDLDPAVLERLIQHDDRTPVGNF
ncbi:MAG: DUF1559 domain-containing protein [Fuerstiella sp.]